MMIDVLAFIGLIILYCIWLFSPILLFICISDGDKDSLEKLVGTVYVGGALAIGYVLFKFVGLL